MKAGLTIHQARARNAEIKSLYGENILTAEEIAKRFGVSGNWVRRVSGATPRTERTRAARNRLRAKQGLPPIGARSAEREKIVKPHVTKAAQLYAEGKGSYQTIANKLRISRNAVAGAVHRAKGLP